MNKSISSGLLLLFVLATLHTFATNYYVSGPTGSDTYPGTLAQPFATITKAAGLTNPGDTVFVMNGTYNSTNGPVLDFHRSGSPLQYITIGLMPDTRQKSRPRAMCGMP